jgi:hypothetical protein
VYILDEDAATTTLSYFTVSNTALTCAITYAATIPTVSVSGVDSTAISFSTTTNQFTLDSSNSLLAGTFAVTVTATTPDGTELTA